MSSGRFTVTCVLMASSSETSYPVCGHYSRLAIQVIPPAIERAQRAGYRLFAISRRRRHVRIPGHVGQINEQLDQLRHHPALHPGLRDDLDPAIVGVDAHPFGRETLVPIA